MSDYSSDLSLILILLCVVRCYSKEREGSKYYSTVVRDVVYNKATDDFTVSVKDLKNDEVMDGER